jgi:hypothetical protein
MLSEYHLLLQGNYYGLEEAGTLIVFNLPVSKIYPAKTILFSPKNKCQKH